MPFAAKRRKSPHPACTAATAGNLRGRAWPANRPSYAHYASFGEFKSTEA